MDLNESYKFQIKALQVAQTQSFDTYNLAQERYAKGLTSLEVVLNSQKQYNDIRSQFLSQNINKINNYLSLILALGGDINIEKNK